METFIFLSHLNTILSYVIDNRNEFLHNIEKKNINLGK
jgi:hypothetical protein